LIPPLADAWADMGNRAEARVAIGQCIQQVLSLKDGLDRASALLRIAKAQLRMDDRSGAESTLDRAEAAARAARVEGDFVAQFKLEILGRIPRFHYRQDLLAHVEAVRQTLRNPGSSSQTLPPAKAATVPPPGGPVLQSALALLRSAPKAAEFGEVAVAQWNIGNNRAAREALDSARAEIRATTDQWKKSEQLAALAEICDRTGNRPLASSLVAEEDGRLRDASSRMSSADRLRGLAFLAEMQAHVGDTETAAGTFRKAIEGARTDSGYIRCVITETVAESEVRAGSPEEAARTAVSVTGITSGPGVAGAYFPNAFEKTYNCADMILDELVDLQLQRGRRRMLSRRLHTTPSRWTGSLGCARSRSSLPSKASLQLPPARSNRPSLLLTVFGIARPGTTCMRRLEWRRQRPAGRRMAGCSRAGLKTNSSGETQSNKWPRPGRERSARSRMRWHSPAANRIAC
jgi:hypothetical protein